MVAYIHIQDSLTMHDEPCDKPPVSEGDDPHTISHTMADRLQHPAWNVTPKMLSSRGGMCDLDYRVMIDSSHGDRKLNIILHLVGVMKTSTVIISSGCRED